MQEKIEHYLNWKSNHAKHAAKAYKYVVKDLCRIGKDLEDITLEDIMYFQKEDSQKYAPSTVSYRTIIIKDFFGFYFWKGETKLNPKLIKIPRFIPNRRTIATIDQVNLMAGVWSDEKLFELRNRVIIKMLSDTGMRVSEVVALNLSDIGDCRAIVHTKKTTRSRLVMWTKDTHRELMIYLGTRICLDDGEAVFITNRHSRITTRQVERVFDKSRKVAGLIDHVTPHALRHGKATRMNARGAQLVQLSSMLGHSETNPFGSLQYVRQSQKDLEETLTKYLD